MLPIAFALTLLCADLTIAVGPHTFQHRTLENGLQALAVDDGQAETVSVFLVYAAGTRAETEATTGLAHLTEHGLFTGTAQTPADEHDAAIRGFGGESNAYTRSDYTTYYAHQVPAATLPLVLALEADRMRNLTWDPPAFEHERERLRVEELGSHDADIQVGARRDYAVWAGEGYGAGILDAQGNTRGPSLTLEQTKAFYDAWYHPRNTAVVVVGGDSAAALDAIEEAFGGLPAGPERPALPETPKAPQREVDMQAPLSRDRTEWVWVGPSLAEPEQRLALVVLSELFEKLTAADGSPVDMFMGGRAGPDLFVIGATGDDRAASVEQAHQVLLSGAWDDAALAQAKTNLRDGYTSTPLRARPYFSLAVDVAVMVALGHADYPAKFEARIDALTREDLLAAAKRWLTPEAKIVLRYEATGEDVPLPTDRKGLRAAAEAASASGDLQRAIAAYEALIELGAGRVDLVIYRYSLGSLHHRLGNLDEARDHLLKGLQVVEYPALRELLEKVEAEMTERDGEAPAPPPAPTSKPTSQPTSKPTSQPSGH
jgi:predicted Zn-dependent peptidase